MLLTDPDAGYEPLYFLTDGQYRRNGSRAGHEYEFGTTLNASLIDRHTVPLCEGKYSMS